MQATASINNDFKTANNTSKPTNEEVKKSIKSFLNIINECIFMLKEEGYDTENLFVIHDALRYELFNNDKIELLGQDKESIIRIENYSKILRDYFDQFEELKKLRYSAIKDVNYYNNRKSHYFDKPKYYPYGYSIKEEILKAIGLLFITGGIISGSMVVPKVYKSGITTPEAISYTVDTEGNETHNSKHSITPYDPVMYIDEYYPTDEVGYRLHKRYSLSTKKYYELTSEELSKIDLSVFTPSLKEVIIDNGINSITEDYYRTFKARTNNYNNMSVAKDMTTSDKIELLGVSFLAGLLMVLFLSYLPNVIINSIYVEDLVINVNGFDMIKDIYNYLKRLVIYKHNLKNNLKELKLAESEKEKYEKAINALCHQIDTTINYATNKLSIAEELNKSKVINAASKKQQELDDKELNNNKTKKELYDNINSIISQLTSEISKIDNKEDYSKILHTIPISEGLLFESEKDHLKIKSTFVPILKFLDLSLIHFDNVDCRGIDFSETNASLNIQSVYNKDLSNSIFNNRNIPDWSDYDGVNITGSNLSEDPKTMFNLDKAIKNDDTVIKLKKINNMGV